MTNRPLRVFLCHSSNDKPAVRELYQKLRVEAWIQPWLDEEELYPGDDWDLAIEKAVEETDVVLVCLSNGSINKRGYVQKELRFALDIALEMPEETVFVIPLRLEECTPPRSLRDWQYADYFEGQRERGVKRLLVSLKRRAESLGLKIEEPAPKKEVEKKKTVIEPSVAQAEPKPLEQKPTIETPKPAQIVTPRNKTTKMILPAWLSGEEEQKEPTPIIEKNDPPAWMKGKDGEKRPDTVKSDLPAWLSSEEERKKTMPTTEKNDLPAWMKGKGGEKEPDIAKSDLPDWLWSAEKQKKSATTAEKPDVPAWMEGSDEELNQAKREFARGNIPVALLNYGKLIKKGKHLEEIINDLRDSLYRYPVEIGIWQTLGDAYMRANRLQEAVEAYSKGEELSK